MLGFSTVDGFIEVKEGVDEMIKYIANEPSVGLFFVQQHVHSSMPYLLTIKDKVVEQVHDVILHTEDIEDSICVVRSMMECGLPVAGGMIKEITKSLQMMSASQPKRGLITPRTFSYRSDELQQGGGGSSRGYLSAVFNNAKQKATDLGWPLSDQFMSSTSKTDGCAPAEIDELPVSSSLIDLDNVVSTVDANIQNHDVSSFLESFDRFRFDREAKLEEWLREEDE